MTPPTHPERIGRYRLLRRLGAGGMGEVFLAEDPNIDRRVALKTVRLEGTGPEIEERKQRLLREARAAGRLIHPNIVTLFDAGEADGMLYLAFELVDGEDLTRRLERPEPVRVGQALRLFREVASALEEAHQQGIVHRDIKPANIMIARDGRAKVTDFGIAKVLGASTHLTQTGSVVGSPQYMSPEQVRGEPLDGRSDIFSLGVVFYEMLAGVRPFDGEHVTTLVYQILSYEPPPLETHRPDLPPRLVDLVRRMMAKDRALRIASAGALAREIEMLEATLGPEVAATALNIEPPTRRLPSTPPPPPGMTPPARLPPTAPVATPRPVMAPPPLPPAPPLPVTTGGGTYATRRVPMAVLVIGALVLLGVAGAAGVGVWLLSGSKKDAGKVAETSSLSPPPSPSPFSEPRTTASPPTFSPTTKPSTASPRDRGPEEDSPPPVSREPVRETARPVVPPPPAPPPPTTVAPPPPAVYVPPPVVAPPPPPAQTEPARDEALTRFEEAAGKARGELSTGTQLLFEVTPETAIIRVWRKGERRGTVMGEVAQFEVKKRKKNAQPLDLPGEGEYLLYLVHDGVDKYVVKINASASKAGEPVVIRATL